MGQQYLIDSNAVIDFLSGKFHGKGHDFMDGVINDIPVVSIITKIEVLGFQSSSEDQILLDTFFEDAIIFELSNAVADQTIKIRKINKIKLPDAIIAATALVHGLSLITRNTHDFAGINDLVIVNPHEI